MPTGPFQEPFRFYLDHQIAKDIRENYATKIERLGGKVVAKDVDAHFVIIRTLDDRERRRIAYAASQDSRKRDINVQYVTYLDDSFKQKRFQIPTETVKGMSGRGGSRNGFTTREDHHLIRYLAAILPDPASGGRMGDKIYNTLEWLGQTSPEYAWASRHPSASWKNRYKKNRVDFDRRIADAVPIVNPQKKHRWPEDRRMNKRGLPIEEDDEEEEEEEEEDDEYEEDERGFGDEGEEDANSQGGNPADYVPDDTRHQSPSDQGGPPPQDRDVGHSDQEDRGQQNQEDGNLPDSSGTDRPNASQEPDYWAGHDDEQDDWRPQQGFEGPPAETRLSPAPAERHARFAKAGNHQPTHLGASGDSAGHNVRSLSPNTRRRRFSFEATPNKRPRLSAENASKVFTRGARRPPGFQPTSDTDSGSDEDEESGSDIDESQNEEEVETMQEEPSAKARSAASTSTYPLSRDKTLVASGPISHKEKGIATVLSSASGMSAPVLGEDEIQHEAVEELRDSVEIIEVDDLPEAHEERSLSPEILPPKPTLTDNRVEEPVAHAARARRRRAEQTQKTERLATYRVTRSRSQSAEPTHFISLPLQGTSNRKGKRKQKADKPQTIKEEPESLGQREEAHSSEGMPELADPQPETLADEDDVVNLVTNKDDFSGISNATSLYNKRSSTLSRRNSPASLNSDDDQTMERIAAQHQARATIIKQPRQSDALLQTFNAGLQKRTPRPTLPIGNLTMLRATEKFAASVLPSAITRASTGKKNPTSTKPWRAPPTPTPLINMGQPSQLRAISATSSSNDTAESIPIAGTRAKAYKRKIEEEEKHKTYTPPSGTRALVHLQQQEPRSQRWG